MDHDPTPTTRPGTHQPPAETADTVCPRCAGSGQVEGHTCIDCGGTGRLQPDAHGQGTALARDDTSSRP